MGNIDDNFYDPFIEEFLYIHLQKFLLISTSTISNDEYMDMIFSKEQHFKTLYNR